MHAWLHAARAVAVAALCRAGSHPGLLVTPPDPFIVGRGADPHAIRLALGDTNRDDHDFLQGLKRISILLEEKPDPSSVDY